LGRKPAWTVERERTRRDAVGAAVWLFGLHAVRDALLNPARRRLSLVVTRNAADRLAEAIAASGMAPRIADPRRFDAPIDPASVHQGAALEVEPLDWGSVSEVCAPRGGSPLVLLLDRVSDPHNVGAVLRSAEVFGARAVIAPQRHSAPETGALAKAASGALERQPYLRVPNLARAMAMLRDMGYALVALDGRAATDLETGIGTVADRPLALALGSEGPGLRELTSNLCDFGVRIPATGAFGSLNVSNAAAIALYAARRTIVRQATGTGAGLRGNGAVPGSNHDA
jgi:23S rRNA (guanosine2251-2'-O)-methyltransferase